MCPAGDRDWHGHREPRIALSLRGDYKCERLGHIAQRANLSGGRSSGSSNTDEMLHSSPPKLHPLFYPFPSRWSSAKSAVGQSRARGAVRFVAWFQRIPFSWRCVSVR